MMKYELFPYVEVNMDRDTEYFIFRGMCEVKREYITFTKPLRFIDEDAINKPKEFFLDGYDFYEDIKQYCPMLCNFKMKNNYYIFWSTVLYFPSVVLAYYLLDKEHIFNSSPERCVSEKTKERLVEEYIEVTKDCGSIEEISLRIDEVFGLRHLFFNVKGVKKEELLKYEGAVNDVLTLQNKCNIEFFKVNRALMKSKEVE